MEIYINDHIITTYSIIKKKTKKYTIYEIYEDFSDSWDELSDEEFDIKMKELRMKFPNPYILQKILHFRQMK